MSTQIKELYVVFKRVIKTIGGLIVLSIFGITTTFASTSITIESDSETFDLTKSSSYSDLLYSVSHPGYLETNAFSRNVFLTTATSMTVVGYTNLYSWAPGYSEIGIRVNGRDYKALNFSNSGYQTFNINLPGGPQTIEIITGAQSSLGFGTGAVYGTWPIQLVFRGDSFPSLFPPARTKRMVIYGDSISIGDSSTHASLQAWPLLVRNAWADIGSIAVYGYGCRSLHDDCKDSSSCQKLANILTGHFSDITDKFIYIQVSTNDYGGSLWDAATFGLNYARLLDDIHSNDSSILVYAQTATLRGNEEANLRYSTLDDYRAQIMAACNARSSYCKVVDGTSILSAWEDYQPDHLHPSLMGQTTYANFIRTLLGI